MQANLFLPVSLLFITVIFLVVLGIVVMQSKCRQLSHYLFALSVLALAIWACGIGVFLSTPRIEVAYTSAIVYYIAAAAIAYFLFLLLLSIPVRESHSEDSQTIRRFWLTLVLPITIMIALALAPDLLISDVILGNPNTIKLHLTGYSIYSVIFLTYVITSWLIFYYKLRLVEDKRYKERLVFAGITVAFGVGFGSLFNLILPLFGNYLLIWVGPLFIVPVVLVIFFSIIKHGLFDVRETVVNVITHLVSISALSVAYLILAMAISRLVFNSSNDTRINAIGAAIAIMMAFLFQPIKRFFDSITNKFFFKDIYDPEEFFTRLSQTMAFTTDLHRLLENVSHEIGRTLKSKQAFFYVNTYDGHGVAIGTPHHSSLPKNDVIRLNEIYKKLANEEIISASLLESDDPIRRMMVSHRVELILPIIKSSHLLGYLCLGEHLNSGYTMRDMRVLGAISDELAIAIQNTLSIQEIKDLNENLQHRINSATKELRSSNNQLQRLDKAKDEFVSMASHQLRTPLTSVKGYISMILDGDVGEVSEQQRHMLYEAFTSSERMVHLINDFLNMSRIQTGKFVIEKTEVDLAKVVKQEIDSLKPNAMARQLSFTYKMPKDIPKLILDENKIRQVIMNYADNAIYYSKPHSTIDVNLSTDGTDVIFTVTDHGIGVPDTEKVQLFSKFFRASNARKQRPDGTGVGLYLAKRVVNAHNGQLIFESTEGKGSVFGFRVPVEANKV